MPLDFRVGPGNGSLPVVEQKTDGTMTYLAVTVDLSGYSGETYRRRIVAGWVPPSPGNWGFERRKAVLSSMRVYEDHYLLTPGNWVVWASINNRE